MMYDTPIYVAGHNGLVGAAIVRRLRADGARQLLLRTRKELDLRRQADVERFFSEHRPQYVFLAAAKVGGIEANRSHPALFLRDNLQMQTNRCGAALRYAQTAVPGLELHLSATGAAADARGLPAYRATGTHQ